MAKHGRDMESSTNKFVNGVPIPTDVSVAELHDNIKQPGSKTWAAIRALGQKPEPAALTCLVELTSHLDPYVRRAAVEASGFHCSGQAASKAICRMLHDRKGFIVRTAIQAAANSRLDDAHEARLGLVKASDKSTRLCALRALQSLWRAPDLSQCSNLSFTIHPKTCEGRRPGPCARMPGRRTRITFSAWSNDSLPRHRVWACEVAAAFGTRELLPAVHDLMADGNGHVRSAAMRAAAEIEAR
jgi:HEAT repeats